MKKNPLERLKIQQQQQELEVSKATKLKHAALKGNSKERNYQGDMGYAGPGSNDRMPGTKRGYTYSKPNFIESLLDLLKIKTYKRKKLLMKPPTKPAVEKYPGVI